MSCNFVTYSETLRTTTNDTGSIGLLYWSPIASASTPPTNETATTSDVSFSNATCVQYPYGGNQNPYLTASRTALLIGVCAASIATALVLFEVLIVRVCCSRLIEGLAFMLAVASSGVVFVIFNNQYCHTTYQCNWGTGAIYNVVACACYFCAWVLNSCTPKPKPLLRKCCCPDRDNDKDEEEAPPSNGKLNDQDDNDDDPYKEPEGDPYDPARFTDASPASAKANEHYAVSGY